MNLTVSFIWLPIYHEKRSKHYSPAWDKERKLKWLKYQFTTYSLPIRYRITKWRKKVKCIQMWRVPIKRSRAPYRPQKIVTLLRRVTFYQSGIVTLFDVLFIHYLTWPWKKKPRTNWDACESVTSISTRSNSSIERTFRTIMSPSSLHSACTTMSSIRMNLTFLFTWPYDNFPSQSSMF